MANRFDNTSIYEFFNLENHTINHEFLNQWLEKDLDLRILSFYWDVCHLSSTQIWIHINYILSLSSSECHTVVLLADWLQDKQVAQIPKQKNLSVFYINGIGLVTYHNVIHAKMCGHNTKWMPNSRFLFPSGKWNKINRYDLWKKFQDKNLLDYCEYSLFLPTDHPDKSFNKNLDNCHHSDMNITSHTSAQPFDHTLYQKTGFRVISETEFLGRLPHFPLYQDQVNDPWLTEKTWMPILNNHPFIMAGQKGTLEKLNHKGYNTFEEHLPHSYDHLPDMERLDAIVANTEFWIHNLSEDLEIRKQVEENYNTFIEQSEHDLGVIHNIISTYDLECLYEDILTHEFWRLSLIEIAVGRL